MNARPKKVHRRGGDKRIQTSRIADRANELLSPDCPRRFYRFAEDVPGWPEDQPVILFLTELQRRRLLSLDIVRAPG